MSYFFSNHVFDKGELKRLIHWFLITQGPAKTLNMVDRLKGLGFHYATEAGISLGIEDLKIPPIKPRLLQNAEEEAQKNEMRFARGKITAVERSQKVIDIWNTTSELLKEEVIHHFRRTDLLNPVYMMAFSGARGNMSQVRQLVGMRGLMSDPQGEIIDLPIKSNFREGLTVTEYIISCYGARKGLVDTALKTANSGYLTRRLVDVAQAVIANEVDCNTSEGIVMTDLLDGNKVLISREKRLVGRVLVHLIQDPKTGWLVGLKNQDISSYLAKKLNTLSSKPIRVRSPLTCQTSRHVCQLCYGWSLASGQLVELGEAIGIIAAQSIGEPGTQLTMRTFHTGGVFSGEVAERVYAPHSGTLWYEVSLAPSRVLGTEHWPKKTKTVFGQEALYFSEKVEVRIQQNETGISGTVANQTKLSLPPYTLFFTKSNTKVYSKQMIAEYSSLEQILKKSEDSDGMITVKEVVSDIEGQVYFHFFNKQGKWIKKQFQNRRQSHVHVGAKVPKGTGLVWVLAGKIIDSSVFNQPLSRKGDFIDPPQFESSFKEPKYDRRTRPVPKHPKGCDREPTDTVSVSSTRPVLLSTFASSFFDATVLSDGFLYKKSAFDLTTATQSHGGLLWLPAITKKFYFPAEFGYLLETVDSYADPKVPNSFTEGVCVGCLRHLCVCATQSQQRQSNYSPMLNELHWHQSLPLPKVPFSHRPLGHRHTNTPPTVANGGHLDSYTEPRYNTLCTGNQLNGTTTTKRLHASIQLDTHLQKKFTFPHGYLKGGYDMYEHMSHFVETFPAWFYWPKKKTGGGVHKHPERVRQLWGFKQMKKQSLKHYAIISPYQTLTDDIQFNESIFSKWYPSFNMFRFQKLISLDPDFSVGGVGVCVAQGAFQSPTGGTDTTLGTNKSHSSLFVESGTPLLCRTLSGCLWAPSKEVNPLRPSVYSSTDRTEKAPLKGAENNLVCATTDFHEFVRIHENGQLLVKQKENQVRFRLNQQKPFVSVYSSTDRTEKAPTVPLKGAHKHPERVQHPAVKTGSFVFKGDSLAQGLKATHSGRVIQKTKTHLTLRTGRPYRTSNSSPIVVSHGSLVLQGKTLFNLVYKKVKTEDIVQGLPKIEELLEARRTKDLQPILNNPHDRLKKQFHEYKAVFDTETAARKSLLDIQQFLVNGVQGVYQSQGVDISDKHVEIIVKQMTSKVFIKDSGQTPFLYGDLVDFYHLKKINEEMATRGRKLAKYEPIILGITKASLKAESFISAASFQETTRVLTQAAIQGKLDSFVGLKENVIIGQLIPAGTGFLRSRLPPGNLASTLTLFPSYGRSSVP